MNSSFAGYEEFRGEFPSRFTGSIVCDREGVGVPYALFNLEPRGRLFIVPSEPVYEGMIVWRAQPGQRYQRQPVQGKKSSPTCGLPARTKTSFSRLSCP